jgi:membrane protease YdiL (CAAX protease family)
MAADEPVGVSSDLSAGYLRESRSFAMGLVSVLPIVALYHVGIIRSGYAERNMAEVWLGGPLHLVGLGAAHMLNVALILAFVAVLFRSARSRAFHLLIVPGIIGEGALYAAMLFQGAPALAGLVDERAERVLFAVNLRLSMPAGAAEYLLALGAGVYEELVFRLLLLGGGALLMQRVFLWTRSWSLGVMLVVSSLLFALAHHIGPLGEPLQSYSFIYRTLCGVFLGTVFVTRGFGIAVWTHAIYNALALLQESA